MGCEEESPPTSEARDFGPRHQVWKETGLRHSGIKPVHPDSCCSANYQARQLGKREHPARCPGFLALLGIKHLTLLGTAVARSLAAAPTSSCQVAQPSIALRKAAEKGEMEGTRDCF